MASSNLPNFDICEWRSWCYSEWLLGQAGYEGNIAFDEWTIQQTIPSNYMQLEALCGIKKSWIGSHVFNMDLGFDCFSRGKTELLKHINLQNAMKLLICNWRWQMMLLVCLQLKILSVCSSRKMLLGTKCEYKIWWWINKSPPWWHWQIWKKITDNIWQALFFYCRYKFLFSLHWLNTAVTHQETCSGTQRQHASHLL